MELKQNKRKRKIPITKIAIEKVPFIQYADFTQEQNVNMQVLARRVLIEAAEHNNSNEVAITCDIAECSTHPDSDIPNFGRISIVLGDAYSVNVTADTVSTQIIYSGENAVVVLLHNHPTTRTFSLEDIDFFLRYYTVHVMVVVTNTGQIHYLQRRKSFLMKEANDLFRSCISTLNRHSKCDELYESAKMFLHNCENVGIYYK